VPAISALVERLPAIYIYIKRLDKTKKVGHNKEAAADKTAHQLGDWQTMKEQNLASELAALTGQKWELEFTGGGCTALVLQVQPKQWAHYYMVTHSEDASVPAPNEPHHLGEYVNEDYDIHHYYFPNRRSMVSFIRSLTKHQHELGETK
jgi:hypothetical protein